MIGGLPWESWVLLSLAAGVGPVIAVAFVRNQLRRRRREARERSERRPAGKPGQGDSSRIGGTAGSDGEDGSGVTSGRGGSA